jgi:S-formylglutathione hydrolase FrmB
MNFRTLEISEPSLMPEGLLCVTVKSKALKQRADLTMFLPKEFTQLRNLPIVTLLHGVYGSHWSWAFKGAAHLTAAQMMRQGEIKPMALVMPSDGLWGDSSGYVQHAHQDFEQWIVEEVPDIAMQIFQACNLQSNCYIAGLSMGGFAALRLAGKYPERYLAASAHSSLSEISQIDVLIEESRDHWADDAISTSVLAALQSARRRPALRFDCGLDDAYLNTNRQLHQALLSLNIEHIYEENPGGHDWSYWKLHLADSLRFFSRIETGLSMSQA